MIEPFEYEKTKTQVKMRDSTVKNDRLDVSALDKPLRKLNHFKEQTEHQTFLDTQKPFSKAFQDSVGRVKEVDSHKSFFQDESLASKGGMVKDYETRESKEAMSRENASVLLSRYLDYEVSYVPSMLNTIDSVENIKVSDPVLQPGMTFIDSRKNMATKLQ